MNVRDTETALAQTPPDSSKTDNCLVSFVIIGRNEGDVLGTSIESVLKAAEELPSWECIFVDSASQDKTVEVALSYPTSVIELIEAARLTAGAGRRVGTRHASGEFVMFLDGDCEVQRGFLEKAIEAFRQNESLSTVVGTRGLVYDRGSDEAPAHRAERVVWAKEKDCEIRSTGGVALVRRAALERVGGFNPFMRSNEERELCLRLHRAGYRLRCIPVPMMVHHSYPWQRGEVTYRELWRRFRSGMMEGPGQLLRQAFTDRTISREHFESGSSRVLGFLAWCLLGAAALIASLVAGSLAWVAIWLTGCLVAYSVLTLRSRGFARPTCYTLRWTLGAVAMVRGFMRGSQMPSGVSTSYTVVRKREPSCQNASCPGE